MDLRLYGVNLDTRNEPTNVPGQEINAVASAAWAMSWYVQFLTPHTDATPNAASGVTAILSDSTALYDGAIGELTIQTTAGTPD